MDAKHLLLVLAQAPALPHRDVRPAAGEEGGEIQKEKHRDCRVVAVIGLIAVNIDDGDSSQEMVYIPRCAFSFE